MTLTPSVTLGGEYNDNLDLVSSHKTADVFGHIVPGFTLGMQRPSYQLFAGYNFGADFYVEETSRNSVAKSQQLYLDYLYRLSPGLTFGFAERFVFDRESNVVSSSGISVGRRDSWRNTATANLGFQATQRTSLNVSASNTLLRYQDKAGTDVHDSDTYRVGVGVGYQFTPRLSGGVDFGVGLLDEESQPDAYNYTPRFGVTYQITPTMNGRVGAGPSITVFKNQTTTTPSVSAGVDQVFRFGSLGIGYDRAITAEAIGVTDRQSASALLRLTTLRREVQFEIAPYYTHTRNPQGTSGRDVDTFSVDLRVRYQVGRNISLTGSYSYYRQQASGQTSDIDQNRVSVGLQYAYPINID